jgi:hypothetical protein
LAVYDPATLAQLPASGQGAAGSFITLGQVQLDPANVPAGPGELSMDAQVESVWERLRLLGRGVLPAQVSPGAQFAFDLYWQAPPGGTESGGAGLPEINTRLTLTPVDVEVPSEVALSRDAAPVRGYATARWRGGEVLRGRQSWQLDPRLPAGAYRLALQMLGPDGAASPPVDLGAITVAGRPHVFDRPARMTVTSGGRLGDFARLLGFDAAPAPLLAPDGSPTIAAPSASASTLASTLALTLYWQAEAASSVPYAVSVQLLDAKGVLRAQHDQQPGGGALPTTSWVPGEVLADPYQIALPADLAPGRYRLILRMYDPATLAALPATDGGGGPEGDGLTLAAVQVR